MRRTVSALLLVIGLTVGMTAPVAADPGPPAAGELPEQAADQAEQAAGQALETADRVLDGEGLPSDPEPSVALAELLAALPELEGAERRQARQVLARPDDGTGPADEPRFRPTERDCLAHVCVHYRTTGRHATTVDWATTSLGVLEQVWSHHVDELGYREPLSDGTRGGDDRLDVYLMNLASRGWYGYCAPEPHSGGAHVAPAYCALDNDFAEFPGTPLGNLRVTAAHEFFHAVQFGYDYAEDGWLKEATATWVEERFAGDVNDNRQYLDEGQVVRPTRSLDVYQGSAEYGNWAFFEYLSQRFGVDFVRGVWNRAADFAGAPDRHSVAAVKSALRSQRIDFPALYAQFAAGNTIPGKTYAEGSQWRVQAPLSGRYRLGARRRSTGPVTRRLDHLTAQHVAVLRGRTRGRNRLVVRIDGPARYTGSVAHALVHTRSGRVRHHLVRVDKRGNAVRRLAFGPNVSKVVVTVANASTRYRCWSGTSWSCQGRPKDDRRAFTVSARTVR